MLFVCRPKVLPRHCLQFLLGVKMAPRETENNGRFLFSQNFRNFRFGAKRNTFRQFSPLEYSKKKKENLKRWACFPGWNFRTECRIPLTFLVVCTSSRSTAGHRDVPGFTTRWNNLLPIGNSTFAATEISGFFFVNGKRPKLM